MYLGSVDDPLLATRMLVEGFCVARDEALVGACTRISVELEAGGAATIRDDGPGLPVSLHQSGKPFAEVLMTVLFACRDAKCHTVNPETLCTLGLAVLNAVCSNVELTVWRDGFRWTQSYAAGAPTTPFTRNEASAEHGTRLRFTFDRDLLGPVEFVTPWLLDWIKTNAASLRFEVSDTRTAERFSLPGG